MLPSELNYKVVHISKENVWINQFKYRIVVVELPSNIKTKIYVGKKNIKYIEEGRYYYSRRAYLTSSREESKVKGDFRFRIDYVNEITEDEFMSKDETVVRINARLCRREDNKVKYLGPMKTPTYSIRGIIKDEENNTFGVLVVGFHGKAKSLFALSEVCYVDIEGYISGPRKPEMPCAIVVKDIIVRKEFENDEKND